MNPNGQMSGGASGTMNFGSGGSMSGNFNMNPNGQMSGGASGSMNLGSGGSMSGNFNMNPNGQMSGGASGSMNFGSGGSMSGNFNMNPNGQMSGGASGSMNLGSGGSASGSFNMGSGGQASGKFSASLSGQDFSFMQGLGQGSALSGQDFSFMNGVPKTGRKWNFFIELCFLSKSIFKRKTGYFLNIQHSKYFFFVLPTTCVLVKNFFKKIHTHIWRHESKLYKGSVSCTQ